MVTGLYSHQMRAPGLADVYGDEFEELYTKYEKETVVDRPSKLKNCGMLFWEPKLKQVPHLCYIKIHVTTNPTKELGYYQIFQLVL